MHLLRDAEVDLTGARAVVIGRSVLVGKPMALLLTNSNATVTLCTRARAIWPTRWRRADRRDRGDRQARVRRGRVDPPRAPR
jgi:methylenetetrahydrofolate dehydrogenase (NADP+)/methenyltetrahydrofolate cyclohydrolase